jgi:hypothetical protein
MVFYKMLKTGKILSEAKRAKECRCKQISTLLEAATMAEKAKAYNELTAVVNEILKHISINHDQGIIASDLKTTLTILGERHEAYIIYNEGTAYHIAWTKNGVAEFENGEFSRYIKFYEINQINKLANLHRCHCDGDTVDFLTIADVTRNILERQALLLGINGETILSLKDRCESHLTLAETLQQVM